jgi:RND family efflux transporter MFP subunit
MLFSKKAAALAVGFVTALSAASFAQNPPPGGRRAPAPAQTSDDVLVVEEFATLEWIEKADVAALREGVIEKMELKIGMPVKAGGTIGQLHSEIAKLSVTKAELAATGEATKRKAQAQKELAQATLARGQRLEKRGQNFISKEEMEKAEAEVNVAAAMVAEAEEKQKLDKAEADLAKRVLEEHTIIAPFDGIIYELMKHPGESVRANEAVVRLGNLDKLRAWVYVPLEYVSRIKEGQEVDLQLRLQGDRGPQLPLEQRKFRGKISFVDPQIAASADAAVRIFADFENPDHLLRPGFKAVMTIYLNSGEAGAPNRPVGTALQPSGLGR